MDEVRLQSILRRTPRLINTKCHLGGTPSIQTVSIFATVLSEAIRTPVA
jgi:hypothetical protein